MLHVTPTTVHFHYDIEKGGHRGFERRHYPERRSALSESFLQRRVHFSSAIPGDRDEEWRPHGRHIEPEYTNIGPDWHSRIRSISVPRHPDDKPTLPTALIERNFHFVRAFPHNWQRSDKEWRYFVDAPVEQQSSKRNIFNRVHLRSAEDLGDENMYMSMIGRKKKVNDVRNGLNQRTQGDKSYRRVEHSSDFYKEGATVPQVNFGKERKAFADRRCYLTLKNEKIPIIDQNEFHEKLRQEEYREIVDEVAQLDRWKPAERVRSAFKVFDVDPNDKNGGKYRPRVR